MSLGGVFYCFVCCSIWPKLGPVLCCHYHCFATISLKSVRCGSFSSTSVASSEEEDEFQIEPHTLQWQAALGELQAVVGMETSPDVLRDLLLAADMDVNRAVNFFLNIQDSSRPSGGSSS